MQLLVLLFYVRCSLARYFDQSWIANIAIAYERECFRLFIATAVIRQFTAVLVQSLLVLYTDVSSVMVGPIMQVLHKDGRYVSDIKCYPLIAKYL